MAHIDSIEGPNRHVLPAMRAPGPLRNESAIGGRAAPYAILFLRLALGVAFLQHVRLNLFEYTPPDISQLFGLPPGVSAFAITWETLVAVALVLGLMPRAAALAGTVTLFIAMFGAHATAANAAFAWQHPAFWIAALVLFALVGDGPVTPVPTLSSGTRS
ncbi:MAG TPA: DoxX family protein [Rhizomicrobium sp.]|jgi:putative oxidoreductase